MKIKKGDVVKIKRTGLMYTNYVDWVVNNIRDKQLLAEYCFGKSFYINDRKNTEQFDNYYRNTEFVVIKVARHKAQEGKKLAYIREKGLAGGCFLIDVNGLEKVKDRWE